MGPPLLCPFSAGRWEHRQVDTETWSLETPAGCSAHPRETATHPLRSQGHSAGFGRPVRPAGLCTCLEAPLALRGESSARGCRCPGHMSLRRPPTRAQAHSQPGLTSPHPSLTVPGWLQAPPHLNLEEARGPQGTQKPCACLGRPQTPASKSRDPTGATRGAGFSTKLSQ